MLRDDWGSVERVYWLGYWDYFMFILLYVVGYDVICHDVIQCDAI